MQFLTNARKYGFGAALSGAAVSSYAAVPAAITTAVEDMQDDGVSIATAIVVAFFAVFAIKFLWRAK